MRNPQPSLAHDSSLPSSEVWARSRSIVLAACLICLYTLAAHALAQSATRESHDAVSQFQTSPAAGEMLTDPPAKPHQFKPIVSDAVDLAILYILLAATVTLGFSRWRYRYWAAGFIGAINGVMSAAITGEICVVVGMVPLFLVIAGVGEIIRRVPAALRGTPNP